MHTYRLTLLLAGCGLAASLVAACRPVQPPSASSPPLVSVTPDQPGNQVGVNQSDNQVLVDLTSETGIGGATLTWPVPAGTADASADPVADLDVVLRVHTKGLEELTLTAGDVQVTASVSSSPPYPVRESARTGSDPLQPIDAQSPYWLAITWPPPAADQPAIPLQAGFFTISVPSSLLEAGHGHMAIQWIDFYR